MFPHWPTCVCHSPDMMDELKPWVMDTSTYTHLCRAGHASIIEKLAPGGVVVIPNEVSEEIEDGRQRYSDIPSVFSLSWAKLTILTDEEVLTHLQLKAAMGGKPREHLGECAVIACSYHRDGTAVIDERAAVEQARQLGVSTIDTMWLVIEAYKTLYDCDRTVAVKMVDDLLGTGMYLPLKSGESVISWAYEEGILP